MYPECLSDFVSRCILKISSRHEDESEDLKSLQERCRKLAYQIPYRPDITDPVASDSSSQRVRLHHSILNVALRLTDACMDELSDDMTAIKSVIDDPNADPNDICLAVLVVAGIEINNRNYCEAESLAIRVSAFTTVLPLIIYESYSSRIAISNFIALEERGLTPGSASIPKIGFRIEKAEAICEEALKNTYIEQFHFQILLKRSSYFAWNHMFDDAIADLDKIIYDFDVNYLSSYRFIVLNAIHKRSSLLREMNREVEAEEWEQFYRNELDALQMFVPRNAERGFWRQCLDFIQGDLGNKTSVRESKGAEKN